jgi:rhomboid family GlyGly-CTERM serine protease
VAGTRDLLAVNVGKIVNPIRIERRNKSLALGDLLRPYWASIARALDFDFWFGFRAGARTTPQIPAIPWLTLPLTGVMFVIFFLSRYDDAILRALWYSRAGLLDGELWRLATGHLVHFSSTHLAGNLLTFAALALLIELQQGRKTLGMLLLLLAIPASVVMLLLAPELHYYGGISSINYGLLTWICLTHAAVNQSVIVAGWRLFPAKLVVVGLIAHVGFQYATARSLFSAASADAAIVVAWQTHLACTITALILAVAGKYRAGKPLPSAA